MQLSNGGRLIFVIGLALIGGIVVALLLSQQVHVAAWGLVLVLGLAAGWLLNGARH